MTYHLHGDVEHSLEVELSAALLEEVFKTLSKQVHDHDVVHLAVLSLLVSHEMQEGHEGLASQLVNQLALPEKHDMSLHFHCFLLHTLNKGAIRVTSHHSKASLSHCKESFSSLAMLTPIFHPSRQSISAIA